MAAGETFGIRRSTSNGPTAAKEARELAEQPEAELAELAGIYRDRAYRPLALQVAQALHAKDRSRLTCGRTGPHRGDGRPAGPGRVRLGASFAVGGRSRSSACSRTAARYAPG